MAKTEVYTCDICKQSRSRNDLARINVRTEGIIIKGTRYDGLLIDICPDCLKRKGFLVEPKPEKKEQAELRNRKSLEDKLLDILGDLGVVFEE